MSSNRAVRIPAAELTWRFSRSSGPGGQHVNTTETRAELLWNPATSTVLSEADRDRVIALLGNRLVAGQLSVVSARYRSQLRNRDDALERLESLVNSALVKPRHRRPSRPSRSSIERAKTTKRRRSTLKQERRNDW